jgi:hypothetical protein
MYRNCWQSHELMCVILLELYKLTVKPLKFLYPKNTFYLSVSWQGAKSMIIAFMGNDRSGKTTISWQIHKFFTDLGFETIYEHEYEYAILGFLFRLVGREKREHKQVKNQPDEYPVFFPLPTFARCYLKLLRSNGGVQKLHLFVRDLSMVAFWKFRYKVKGKLPFEVRLLGTQYRDKIKTDNQA